MLCGVCFFFLMIFFRSFYYLFSFLLFSSLPQSSFPSTYVHLCFFIYRKGKKNLSIPEICVAFKKTEWNASFFEEEKAKRKTEKEKGKKSKQNIYKWKDWKLSVSVYILKQFLVVHKYKPILFLSFMFKDLCFFILVNTSNSSAR